MIKKLFVVSVLVLLLTTACSSTTPQGEKIAGVGTYSQGYRMGQLSKISTRGFFAKAGEGTMLLGNESGPFQIPVSTDSDGHTTYRTINPWHFSTTPEDVQKYDAKVGDFVWVRYNQAQLQDPLHYGTDYLAAELGDVTKVAPDTCMVQPPEGNYSAGTRVGRIVKASYKGIFGATKTYELIIQEGMAGSKFVEMSITDPSLYDCAVTWLKSGMPVKIEYKQLYLNISWNKTDYRIWKIAPAPTLN